MGKKVALEWNEPTFESIVANNRAYPQTKEPAFIRKMLQEDNRSWFVKYCDLFHTLVLMGALSWVLLEGHKGELSRLLFALIFIGGFLFQLFWETLSQYTLVYFLLLIPYAVWGYMAVETELEHCLETRRIERGRAAVGGGLLLLVVFVALSGQMFIHDLLKLDYDDATYTKELQEMIASQQEKAGVLADGHYVVSPVVMEGYGIASPETGGDEELARQTPLELQEIGGAFTGILELHHEADYDMLRIQSTQLLLSLSGDAGRDGTWVGQDFDNAMWKIIEIPETGYAITYGKSYALAVAEGRLVLQPYTGEENQLWRFVRI